MIPHETGHESQTGPAFVEEISACQKTFIRDERLFQTPPAVESACNVFIRFFRARSNSGYLDFRTVSVDLMLKQENYEIRLVFMDL